MQREDRFSTIVVVAVTVVVAVVFLTVHGLPVGEQEASEAAAEPSSRVAVTPVAHSSTRSFVEGDAARDDAAPPEPAPGVAHAALASPSAADDDEVRTAVRGVIAHRQVERWLAPDRLVYRFVHLVDAVAEGELPDSEPAVLGPWGDVVVRRTEDRRLVLAAGTYHRYRPIVEMMATLDPKDAVALYRRLEPACEAAYRRLGTGGGMFEDRLRMALVHLLRAPVPGRTVEVEQRSTRYAFADHDLEALSEAQKHVVRMGRGNAMIFQGALRGIARELGWTIKGSQPSRVRVAGVQDGSGPGATAGSRAAKAAAAEAATRTASAVPEP
jgi:hypothetical protein